MDLVAQDADGTYMLVLVEDRPWGAEPDQATQLQQKINSYAGFILDGSLARHYSELKARLRRAPLGHIGLTTPPPPS